MSQSMWATRWLLNLEEKWQAAASHCFVGSSLQRVLNMVEVTRILEMLPPVIVGGESFNFASAPQQMHAYRLAGVFEAQRETLALHH
jgi:hypothetical protein